MLMLVLLLEIAEIHVLVPRREHVLLHRVLVEVWRANVDLWLVVEVELGIPALAVVALWAVWGFSKATGALWMSMLHNDLALALSYLK